MHKKGYGIREIARELNRSASSISDELKRNGTKKGYNPKWAQAWANERQHDARFQRKRITSNTELQTVIEGLLYQGQSPENIAGRINHHEKHLAPTSKDSIYRFIKSQYGRRAEYHRGRKKKRPTKGRRAKSVRLQDRTFIDKRPLFINKRERIGDAEADFLVSGRDGKGIILVVVDRKSRSAFLEQIVKVTIENVHLAFLKIKARFPELKTLTADNDLLLQRHKELEILLVVKIYFCHPYHSWEKGTVENTNKNIRQDIPKGSDISRYSKRIIHNIEIRLNTRILKCLDYKRPVEVLAESRKRKKR